MGPVRRAIDLARSWPLYRQLTGSVCPSCAVGGGRRVYAKDGRVTHIEGDPDSPISRGRRCPRSSSGVVVARGWNEGAGTFGGRVERLLHARTVSRRRPVDDL